MDANTIQIGTPVSYENMLLMPSATVYGTVVGFSESDDQVMVRTDLDSQGEKEKGRYETNAVSSSMLKPSDHPQRFDKYNADNVNEAMYVARDTFLEKYDYEQIQGMALQYLRIVQSNTAGGLPESTRALWIDN